MGKGQKWREHAGPDDDEIDHHMLSDCLLKSIIENEAEKDRFDKGNKYQKDKLEIISENIMKKKPDTNHLDINSVMNPKDFYLRKGFRQIKKENLSKDYLNSLLNLNNEEIEKIKINRVNLDSRSFKLYYEYGEAYIENIENNLKKIDKFLRNRNNFLKLNNKKIENIMNMIDRKMFNYLERIQNILRNTSMIK